MGCEINQNCGGCSKRHLDLADYRAQKEQYVRGFLEKNLGDLKKVWEKPVFISDGTRRRAAFAFVMKEKKILFGFNEGRSNQIADISKCKMLTPKLNEALDVLRAFLLEFCQVVFEKKQKNKKFLKSRILSGDLLILEAENGLDVVLETSDELCLEHRMIIFDFMNRYDLFIRFSWRKKHAYEAEPIIEKTKPFIKIENLDVFVAPGDFLQPSKEGEQALIDLVIKYVGPIRGKMIDLFCGIGTFSYALSALENTKVLGVDVSSSLLKGFEQSLHRQMIHNVRLLQKNLFLYPLDLEELKGADVIVFDPPRAGAKEQVKEFCLLKEEERPKKIIAVSCNIETFARDAKMLLYGGYRLEKLTLVDQFVYSDHSEVVCLFTNGK